MTIPRDILASDPGLHEWAILSAWRGSLAHGTYVPSSDPNSIDDKDVMTVCVPPFSYYMGLREYGSRGTREVARGEWDIVCYEARKFIRLLAKGNPNVLSLLWCAENDYLKRTFSGQLLVESRKLFATRSVYHSFTGYAHGQLHRMRRFEHHGYMGEKRKALVEKHGYDSKNAAHLIRLLRMGIEFLTDGDLVVKRPDGPQLLEIKRGEWPLERIQAEADALIARAQEALIHSPLPPKPDMDKINALAVRIVKTAWDERGEYLPR